MKEEGRDVTIAGCVMLRFGKTGLFEELRDYWILKEGRVLSPKELFQAGVSEKGKLVESRSKMNPATSTVS